MRATKTTRVAPRSDHYRRTVTTGRRRFGAGDWLLTLLTGGAWLLLWPIVGRRRTVTVTRWR